MSVMFPQGEKILAITDSRRSLKQKPCLMVFVVFLLLLMLMFQVSETPTCKLGLVVLKRVMSRDKLTC